MSKETTEQGMIAVYRSIPYSVISKEIPDFLKDDFYAELGDIMKFYDIYKNGQKFSIEGTNGDYQGSDVRYKKCKELIDKEARFLFASTPDFYVNRNAAAGKEKDEATVINDFLQQVLLKNAMSDKLVKAAKDCFIGRRVACMLNFNSETGISITFLKSYEFVYEKDSSETLTRLVAFYTILDTSNKKDKRIKKKSYEMKNGVCYTHELLFDGLGNQIEETVPEQATLFSYIPAVVIINDGLSNDGRGESEIEQLDDLEGLYSKLANGDIDAGRKSMNAVRYAIDASPESTSNLSTAPGAFWDIQSDQLSPDPRTAQIGMLEPSMNYSGPLKITLDRVDNQMHSQLDVPNINSEQLQGVITSGKTLKALYWGLTVRCDEKMLSWGPALTHVAQSILDGAVLYPESAAMYTEESIPDVKFDIDVVNNYPLLEDDTEEKTMDLAEVSSSTMSRKAYMKKWRQMTDDEIDEELDQILREKQLFENSMIPMDMAEEKEPEGSSASVGSQSEDNPEMSGTSQIGEEETPEE